MTIQQAKKNIINNFRANYSADHLSTHDIEIFILNSMEQLEQIVKKEYGKYIKEMIKENTSNNRYRDGETAFDIVKDIK